MEHTSLTNVLQDILRDAGEAHHTLIARMESEGSSKSAIESENANWHRFYAEYVARRLAPYLCGLQCHRTFGPIEPAKADLPLPLLATVRGKWDTTNTAQDAIRLGVSNCHDTGDC